MSAQRIIDMHFAESRRENVQAASQPAQPQLDPKAAAREHLKAALFIRRMSTNRGEKSFWTQSARRRLAEYRALPAVPAAETGDPCSMADFPTLGDDVDAGERDQAAEISYARRGW